MYLPGSYVAQNHCIVVVDRPTGITALTPGPGQDVVSSIMAPDARDRVTREAIANMGADRFMEALPPRGQPEVRANIMGVAVGSQSLAAPLSCSTPQRGVAGASDPDMLDQLRRKYGQLEPSVPTADVAALASRDGENILASSPASSSSVAHLPCVAPNLAVLVFGDDRNGGLY